MRTQKMFALIGEREYDTVQEKLYDLCYQQALHIFSKRYNFRLLVQAENMLPEPISATHQNQKVYVLRFYRSLILEGVNSGEFVVADAATAALSIIGLVNRHN